MKNKIRKLIQFPKPLKIFFIIFSAVIILIILAFILNNLTRKQIFLSDFQKEKLSKIYPEEHLERLKIYKDGLFALGSSKALCPSAIYINSRTSGYYFENSSSDESLIFLAHEIFHTFQYQQSCLGSVYSSLSNQLRALLSTGSRSNAYNYYLNKTTELNSEQEAEVISDFYCVFYTSASSCLERCLDCEVLPDSEILLRARVRAIYEKYLNEKLKNGK